MKIKSTLDKMIAEAMSKVIESPDQFPMDGGDLSDMSDILGIDLNAKGKDAAVKPEEPEEVLEEIEEEMPGKKVDSGYLYELIAEVMVENFGASPFGGDDDLLQEAWDSGWPSNFEGLRSSIKEFTTKGKNTEDILSKYAMEAIAFSFLNQVAIWESYRELFGSFASSYFQTGSTNAAAAEEFFLGKNGFMQKSQAIGSDFRDVHDELGGLAALRVLNKMVSRLNKGVAKFWKSVDGGEEILEQFKKMIDRKLLEMQFREVSLITSKLYEIIQFVNMDKGDDNTKKLADFYKMLISEGWNRNALINRTDEWIEVESFTVDMTPCTKYPAGFDEPCVFHKFDDGYFWYDTKTDECDVSGIKLKNCGQASSAGGILYNLMSHSETGKPNWHVMLEYNDMNKSIIQVLGNANSVPKEEYWPHIKWIYEKLGKPEVKNDAWEHVRGNNIKNKVYKFLEFLGTKSSTALTASWGQMEVQIADGFYNVKSYEEDHAPTNEDFSKLGWIGGSNYVNMSVRIRKKLIEPREGELTLDYEYVRDLKAAARAMNNSDQLYSILEGIIPDEWDMFFDKNNMTQKVRFSHSGRMMLYLSWTSKTLQNFDDDYESGSEGDYRNQIQREVLAAFMQETQQNFTVKAMSAVAEYMGNKLQDAADEHAMSRDSYNRGDDLDEGKRMKIKSDQDNQNLDEESQAILEELIRESKK